MKKETYCLGCRKYTKSINPKIVRNRQNLFIKEHQAMGLLSDLGIKTHYYHY